MGRPTIYNQEIMTKALDYMDRFDTEYGDEIPSVGGLAVALGVCRDTLYDWSRQDEKSEFSYMLKQLITRQRTVLLNNGLNGKFNSQITKLVLSKHGYHDRAQQTDTQVQVIINRGGVVLKSCDETIAIEDASPD